MVAPARNRWVIVLSFLLALMLGALPLPDLFEWGRPEWLAMVVIYWVIALPHRVGILTAWVLGLLQDVLHGSILGEHALALALVAALALALHQRIRMFPLWQQGVLVVVLVGLYQLILHWLQSAFGASSNSLLFLLPALISGLLWPWVFVVLRGVRRTFSVN